VSSLDSVFLEDCAVVLAPSKTIFGPHHHRLCIITSSSSSVFIHFLSFLISFLDLLVNNFVHECFGTLQFGSITSPPIVPWWSLLCFAPFESRLGVIWNWYRIFLFCLLRSKNKRFGDSSPFQCRSGMDEEFVSFVAFSCFCNAAACEVFLLSCSFFCGFFTHRPDFGLHIRRFGMGFLFLQLGQRVICEFFELCTRALPSLAPVGSTFR